MRAAHGDQEFVGLGAVARVRVVQMPLHMRAHRSVVSQACGEVSDSGCHMLDQFRRPRVVAVANAGRCVAHGLLELIYRVRERIESEIVAWHGSAVPKDVDGLCGARRGASASDRQQPQRLAEVATDNGVGSKGWRVT